jgi:hypothetical protein
MKTLFAVAGFLGLWFGISWLVEAAMPYAEIATVFILGAIMFGLWKILGVVFK